MPQTSSLLMSILLAFSLLACASSGDAVKGEGGDEPAFDHMSWQEVEASMAKGAVLVDARGAESYAKGHIEGAINVPSGDDAALSKLPEDTSTQLIFYCGGPSCSASTRCAEKARTKGYTRIAEYKGGYPEWLQLKLSK